MAVELTREQSRRVPQAGPGQQITQLTVRGMSCGNCARHVVEALQTVTGVQSASASVEEQAASVRWAAGVLPDQAAVIQAVERAGYRAESRESTEAAPAPRQKFGGWGLNLWVGLLGTLPLMVGEWLLRLGMTPWFQWFSFGLAALVQVVAGARFYRGAWAQLKSGSSNMDTLVALGSTTAFGYSAWALLSGLGGHTYFMEAAAIITVISVGHWLESRVSARASSALRQLLNLAPMLARRRSSDGKETEVSVATLQAGDEVVLRPGDRVPIDGEVVEGAGAVEEAMLTGESVPVDKAVGSEVYAGTANLDGRLVVRVTATGEATALAHVIQAVQRAQSSRANIQRLGDRVSNVFVPVVVAIALVSGLWWGLAPTSARQVHDWFSTFLWHAQPPIASGAAAFIIAAAVLIIACPCAMGLATPAAIMAGSNAAAQRGILIRDGVALEKAGLITAVLFDKTGTLTFGRPEVVAVWERNGQGRPIDRSSLESTTAANRPGPSDVGRAGSALLALAAGLAAPSAHPVSRAVARLSSRAMGVQDWEETRGAGVKALVPSTWAEAVPAGAPGRTSTADGSTARLGSLRWLKELGIEGDAAKQFIEAWSTQGATLVGLAIDKHLEGMFAIKDAVKPGAAEVVAQLQRQGLKTFLVTGDNARAAASIAAQSGIPEEHVFAEVRPEQKSELVSRLRSQGERVAFVGDGINDAPALEQADLGIAVSRASDIAREAADIILLNSEIGAVPESLGLAQATLRTIKQNLFWAFFYNAVGIPLAALGFMSPILCAAAMGFSDMVVIGNALRLRRWRLR
jgi:Cu+-exporting ATPase